jgi:hypothetical protein
MQPEVTLVVGSRRTIIIGTERIVFEGGRPYPVSIQRASFLAKLRTDSNQPLFEVDWKTQVIKTVHTRDPKIVKAEQRAEKSRAEAKRRKRLKNKEKKKDK